MRIETLAKQGYEMNRDEFHDSFCHLLSTIINLGQTTLVHGLSMFQVSKI